MADAWRRGALILTVVSWFLGGCVRRVPVEGYELPWLARYRERGEVVLVKEDRVVVVQAKHRPVLVVEGRRIPLAEVRAEDVAGVEQAVLELKREDDGWRPRGAGGLSLAGPLGIGGVSGHWYPTDAVALEIGALPAADLGVVYAGFRLRPWRLGGRVLPFVGAFVHGGGAVDVATGEGHRWAATGPRLGVDVEVSRNRRVLLGLEFDLVHPLGGTTWATDLQGSWIPWGGGHLLTQF
jgi:hypothetical protein